MSRPEEIIKLFDTLKKQRTNFDNTYQEIIDHIDPHHKDITTEGRLPGERKNAKQFDGTALYASQVFGDFYQGSVFNQGTTWFSIKHRNDEINKNPTCATWLATTRDILLRNMRYFYGPGGQAIGAWALFGNGPILIEEVAERKDYQSRLRYTSIPWGQYVMAEGEDGKVDQFIREIDLDAHLIVKLWGDKCSDDVRKAAEKDPYKKFCILHSILPRDFQEYSKSSIKTSKDLDWASCWVEKDKKVLLKESGYRKFPVALARYKQISGEVYARGLGEVALADQKSLNAADEMALLKWGRELDPPTLTRRNSIINGILNKQAKGNTIVNGDPRTAVAPLFEGTNWIAHDAMADRKQKAIMRVFHVDEILNLLSHETPQLTAFEVNARLTLLQQILGPVFGQNDVDFFSVVIDVSMDNLAHLNLLTKPPDEIAQAGDKDSLDFVFEGPLARAQRNQEIVAIQQTVADIGGIQPFYPEVVKIVDWEKVARRLAEARGTNDLLVTEEDFLKEVNALNEQANAQKAAQLIGGGAEALGKMAPALKVMRESAGSGGEGQVAA